MNTLGCWEGGTSEKPWNLWAFSHPQLCPTHFFHWLFLTCLLYNKLVMVSKLFSCVLWTLLANNQTWDGILGAPDLNPSWTEVWVTWVSSTWDWHLQWEHSCETAPVNLWSLTLTLGSVWIESNCEHPFGVWESWRTGCWCGKSCTFGVRSDVSRNRPWTYSPSSVFGQVKIRVISYLG